MISLTLRYFQEVSKVSGPYQDAPSVVEMFELQRRFRLWQDGVSGLDQKLENNTAVRVFIVSDLAGLVLILSTGSTNRSTLKLVLPLTSETGIRLFTNECQQLLFDKTNRVLEQASKIALSHLKHPARCPPLDILRFCNSAKEIESRIANLYDLLPTTEHLVENFDETEPRQAEEIGVEEGWSFSDGHINRVRRGMSQTFRQLRSTITSASKSSSTSHGAKNSRKPHSNASKSSTKKSYRSTDPSSISTIPSNSGTYDSANPSTDTVTSDSPSGVEQSSSESITSISTPAPSRGLDPRFQRHEAYSKYENEANDDLASLLSFQSFADSGYESQITVNDDSEIQDAVDELKSLLLTDLELQPLLEEAFQRSKAREQFISKFRMLLKICGTELKKEAINASHEAAAHLIQAKATYIATHIKKAYETGVSDIRDDTKSANLEALLQRRYDPSDDSDSEVEEPYEGTKLAPSSLKELKAFMTTSTAFGNMRNKFRRMVYPDPLTAISNTVFREHELKKSHSTTVSSSATFRIRWDVYDYIRTELEYDSKLHERNQLLESVLVVVGSAPTAYATSALNYMRWRWPESNCELLRIVQSTLTGTSNGEASVPVNIFL